MERSKYLPGERECDDVKYNTRIRIKEFCMCVFLSLNYVCLVQ